MSEMARTPADSARHPMAASQPQRTPRRSPGRRRLAGALLLWLAALTVGGLKLIDYGGRPGDASAAPAHWPTGAEPIAAAAHGRLCVFIHPHCPCSRATLANLERALAHCKDRLDVTIWLVAPHGAAPSWAETDLQAAARHIVGASVRVDRDGAEARRFGARTSGQAMLYGADGRLVFSGGLTSSRGHEGVADGTSAILAWAVRGEAPRHATTPVYGCPLFDANSAPSKSTDSCGRCVEPVTGGGR